MDVEDIKQIILVLKAEYGNKVIATEDRVRVWEMVLGHATPQEAQLAVAQLLSEARQFPPSVGEINQQILKNRNGPVQDWSQLWDLVLKAGQKGIYYAEEESKRLPEAARKAIGGVSGLREVALSPQENIAVIRAQFRQRLESATKVADAVQTTDSLMKALPKINVKLIR